MIVSPATPRRGRRLHSAAGHSGRRSRRSSRCIRALAEYERLAHECVATEALLHESLFGAAPGRRSGARVRRATTPAGFALWFRSYSTFLARPGIYLEDLFVFPEYRGRGLGRRLLASPRAHRRGARLRARGVGGARLERGRDRASTARSAPSRSTTGRPAGSPATRSRRWRSSRERRPSSAGFTPRRADLPALAEAQQHARVVPGAPRRLRAEVRGAARRAGRGDGRAPRRARARRSSATRSARCSASIATCASRTTSRRTRRTRRAGSITATRAAALGRRRRTAARDSTFTWSPADRCSAAGSGCRRVPRSTRFREQIDEDHRSLARILRDPTLRKRRFGALDESAMLTRMPRGYARRPSRRGRCFGISRSRMGRELTDAELFSPKLADLPRARLRAPRSRSCAGSMARSAFARSRGADARS